MTKTRHEIDNDDNAMPQQQITWANIGSEQKEHKSEKEREHKHT